MRKSSFQRIVALVAACFAPATASRAAQSMAVQVSAAVPVQEKFATTPDGVRLYYRVAGSDGPYVIAPFALYHGSSLDPLAKGRRIVTYDPRGRGRSMAAPLDRVSLDYLLTDLDTVRQAVGAERVSIIGWSGAGMETFVYTLRNPERVDRLVQLAPVAPRFEPYGTTMMQDRDARTDKAARAALQARVNSGEFRGKSAELCRARAVVSGPPLLFDPSIQLTIPDVCDSANEHPDTIGAYFGALFASIDGYDWRDELAQVKIPRLVVHGVRDNIPLAGNEEWVRGQADARLLIVGRTGHFPQYENPAVTLPAIDRFLSGDWPPGAKALP